MRALALSVLVMACKGGSGDPEVKPPGFSAPPAGVQGDRGPHPGSEPPARGTGSAVDRPSSPTDDGPRIPMVDRSHAYYDRLEGTAYENECDEDADCHASGCGGEVCSADKDAASTCELLPGKWPPDSACGCVDRLCQWWNPHGVPLPSWTRTKEPVEAKPPQEGRKCGSERCKPGEECITYRGIAGAKGPTFRECAIRCRRGQPRGGCPPGMRCVMIADGPGPICK